jgi:Rap1a immunity proteins
MRSYSVLVVLGLSLVFPVAGPSQDTAARREPLVKGTLLYKWCGAAAKEIRKDKDGHMSFTGDSSRMPQTMNCLGYIRGVVDSIGLSDKPGLDNDKRLERYFETVYMFLDHHPERRGESAANLVKEALQARD